MSRKALLLLAVFLIAHLLGPILFGPHFVPVDLL